MKHFMLSSILIISIMLSGCQKKSFEDIKKTHSDNMKKMGATRSNKEKIKILENDIEMIEAYMKDKPEYEKDNHTNFLTTRGFKALDYSIIGFCKNSLKDFAGAISDYTQAIELINIGTNLTNDNKGSYLYYRAKAKFSLGGNGCEDFIEAEKNLDESSVTRGLIGQEMVLYKCN